MWPRPGVRFRILTLSACTPNRISYCKPRGSLLDKLPPKCRSDILRPLISNHTDSNFGRCCGRFSSASANSTRMSWAIKRTEHSQGVSQNKIRHTLLRDYSFGKAKCSVSSHRDLSLHASLHDFTVILAISNKIVHRLRLRSVMATTNQLNLAGLLGLCGVLFIAQRQSSQETPDKKPTETSKKTKDKVLNSTEASQWPFLTVFALVMGSDWLQARLLSGSTTKLTVELIN